MQASLRLARTPWLLMVLVLLVGIGLSGIGAIATSEHTNPAELGQVLYQTFFSVGYFVVIVFGPAMSANLVANEREGRTWEALLLAGLPPQQIAREKFLAGVAGIGAYLVALAPIAGMSFLFGGVSAIEVFFGFVLLVALACIASLLGTAMSAMFKNQRGAMIATLALGIVLGGALFALFGVGASFAIHDKWHGVPEGHPIWLPMAWSRASFGLDYVLLLIVMPLSLLGTCAWFLYEATVAHMREDADDRASGFRRWFLVCTPGMGITALCPMVVSQSGSDRTGFSVCGALFLCAFLFGTMLLLAGEPVSASRRVRARLEKLATEKRGVLFMPGLMTTYGMLLAIAIATGAFMTFADLVGLSSVGRSRDVGDVLASFAYGGAFFTFMLGLMAMMRARGLSPLVTRLLAFGTLLVVSLGPPIFALIVKAATDARSDDVIWLAAPSPFYVGAMFDAMDSSTRQANLAPGFFCIAMWTAAGAILFAMARGRVSAKRD
jgi:hypothetical protein